MAPPTRTPTKTMMIQSTNQVNELHKLKISNVDGSFHFDTEVTKVNHSQLFSLGNPKYKEKVARFPHLQGVIMDHTDEKADLPIHLILGASKYARVKVNSILIHASVCQDLSAIHDNSIIWNQEKSRTVHM